MARVRIIFDGSLVVGPTYPKRPHGPYTRPGPLFAVLPHSPRQRSRRSNDTAPEYIPAHLPGIFTNMSPKGREEDLKYKGYFLWCPLRERLDLAIDGVTTAGKLTYDHDPHYDPSCFGSGAGQPTTDIAAVSDIREVWPARQRLRRGMLARKGRVSRRVSAQVFVPAGTVSGSSEYDRRDDGVQGQAYDICAEFYPRRTPETVKKRLLPQVVVTIEVKHELEIRTSSLDTGRRLDPIRFDVRPSTPATRNDIWIVNGDIVNIGNVIDLLVRRDSAAGADAWAQGPSVAAGRPVLSPHEPQVTRPADDFELLYSVLGGRDGGGLLTIPYTVPLAQRPCYTALVEREPSLFSLFS